jgi:Tfp pilus assembly protein PilF
MQRFLLLIFVFINISLSYSQGSLPPGTYTSTNKKAIKYFEESKKMFQIRKDAEAEKLIKKAIEEDPQFIEAHSAYADFLMGNNRVKEAIPLYEKAIQLIPKYLLIIIFTLGGAYYMRLNMKKQFLVLKK